MSEQQAREALTKVGRYSRSIYGTDADAAETALIDVSDNGNAMPITDELRWTVITVTRSVAAHVAAVVAEKDAEIAKWKEVLVVRERVLKRRETAALARLGAIAAKVDELAAMNARSDEAKWGANRVCEIVAAILADSAGAIAKHEQEVRAEVFREVADLADSADEEHALSIEKAGHERIIRPSLPWFASTLRTRANALTKESEPTAGEDGAAWFDHGEPMPAQKFESIAPVVVHEQGRADS